VGPRVLVLSWEFPPIVEGGLARHVRKLTEQLAAHGAEVHVLTRGGDHAPAEEERHGVVVHRVREPSFPRDDLDAFLAWVAQLNADMLAAGAELRERYDFDLLHSHDWLVAGAAERLAQRMEVPWVVTVHATEHGRHQGWVDKHPQSHIHAVERRMVHRADRVIACSDFMRGQLADVFGVAPDRVTSIPNGIDVSDLHTPHDLDQLRARYAAPGEKLVLLAGRLVYEKGFQVALDALGNRRSGVLRRVPGVRYLVAGTGTHEDELKAQARRLRIVRRGTFAGWLGDDTLHGLYRIADLCVIPSLYEPFGLVALEAMASGCPCVAADTGGLREVVPGDVGLRFRSRDAAALAATMERVLTDPDLRDRLVADGREHVLRFDWADVARRTARLYDDLLPQRAERV
jgi:glycogen(starch) synthase